jgi:hypothetical protein
MMVVAAMSEIANHAGKEPWPSLESASWWFDKAGMVLAGSLFIGFVCTVMIIWLGIVKEHHWDLAREAAQVRIAELNNETARLHANDLLTNNSLLAGLQTARANAIAAEANRSLAQAIAVAQGLVKREDTSELTRVLYIVSRVAPFAGKKFDAVVTSSAVSIGGLLGSIKGTLKQAGWIEIERDDPTAGTGIFSMDRGSSPGLVRIDVDASKDSELLHAAEALAAALNAEGIAATVEPKAETDAANINVIHIFVGSNITVAFSEGF